MFTQVDSSVIIREQLRVAQDKIIRQFAEFDQFKTAYETYDNPFQFHHRSNSLEFKIDLLQHKNYLTQYISQLNDYVTVFDSYPSLPLKFVTESNLSAQEKSTLIHNLQKDWNQFLTEIQYTERMKDISYSIRLLKNRLSEIHTFLDISALQLDTKPTTSTTTTSIPDTSASTTNTAMTIRPTSAILKTTKPITTDTTTPAQSNDNAIATATLTTTKTANSVSSLHSLFQQILATLEDKSVYQNINIPTFNGDSTQFDTFIEMFTTLIDPKPISNLQKLAFLKGLCTGNAAKCLDILPTTDHYYPIALQLLQKRYGDKMANKLHLLRRLRSLPESPLKGDALLNTLNDILSISRRLTQLGENLDNTPTENLILSKFPLKIRNKCISRMFTQQKNNEDTNVDIPTLLDYLEDIILEFVHCELCEPDPKRPTSTVMHSKTTHQSTKTRCLACHQDHPFRECTKYNTPHLRYTYAKRHKLCSKCLSPKHDRTQCDKPDCKDCNKPHHRALCFQNTPPQTSSNSSK